MVIEDPYGYRPNLPVNIVGCVLFGLVVIVQFVLGIYTRDWWFWVTWVIASGLELTGYIGRALAHTYINSEPLYEMQLVCLILGPAFMAAGLYYQLAKEVTIYGRQYSRFRPMTYNAIFTTCDVVSLVVQAAGGGDAAANVNSSEGPQTGGWVMVAGISFQVLILCIFIIMFGIINWRIYRDDPANYNPDFAVHRQRPLFKYWVPAVAISLLFLLIRSAYRIAELSEGWTGHLMTTERYFLILDGLMIIIGMAPLCVIYPGLAHGYIPIDGLHYDSKKQAKRQRKLEASFTDSEAKGDSYNDDTEPPIPQPTYDEFHTPPPL